MLACLGIAACGPEGWQAQQGDGVEALLPAASSEARGMRGWSECPGGSEGSEEIQRLVRLARAELRTPEASVGMCHWSEQGLDAVAFVTDEEDFSPRPVPFSPRGSYSLKNGAPVVIAVGDEDDHSPDSIVVVSDEDDHSGFRIFVTDEEDFSSQP
jgi:hypothetical protein